MVRAVFYTFLTVAFFFACAYVLPHVFALTTTKTETVSVSALVGTFLSLEPVSTISGRSSSPVESIVMFQGVAYPNGTVIMRQVGGASVTVVSDAQGLFSGSIVVVAGQSSQLVITSYDTAGVLGQTRYFEFVFPKGYVTTIDRITLDTPVFMSGATPGSSSVQATAQPGDCSSDGVLDEQDFVMLQYWRGQRTVPVCGDINHDGVINLQDFSLLAYWWKK